MTDEPVSFNVIEAGTPNLAAEGEEPPVPSDLTPIAPVVAPPGWTADEAAQMVASIFTTGALVAYVARWSTMPDAELWPYLAATKSEFPQLGAGLVPLLDRFMPKGTGAGLAAAGVGILAGVGEVGVAAARRVKVVVSIPPKGRENVQPSATPPSPAAPAASGGGNYRMPPELVKVAQQSSEAMPGLGI